MSYPTVLCIATDDAKCSDAHAPRRGGDADFHVVVDETTGVAFTWTATTKDYVDSWPTLAECRAAWKATP